MNPELNTLTPLAQECLQQLMRTWFDFERMLNRVPIVQRMETGRFSIEDYRQLLKALRQQVIEGSRWITRCASSFDREFADVRSIIIGHAQDEHRDYETLENDYVASGGNRDDIMAGERNVGAEALHGFLMYRASQPNPVDLIGAMWIIEGLGEKMASGWAQRIDELTQGNGSYVQFMRYHGANDEAHLHKLYSLLDRTCTSPDNIKAMVRTAKVVARLYALQLEEIDSD